MKVLVEQRLLRQICTHCDGPIEPATPTVLATMHSHKVAFHPECWIKMIDNWVTDEPRGRKRLDLSEADKDKRLKLQHTYAVNKHRLRRYTEQFRNPQTANKAVVGLRITRLEYSQKLLTMELERLGGLPSHWAKLE